MIEIQDLFKVLHDPKDVYSRLKGNVTWKEGLILWFVYSAIALFLTGIFSRALKVDIIPINFGFGALVNPYTILFFGVNSLISLFIVVWTVNWLSNKWGGDGNWRELLGMFGYSYALMIPQALISGIIMFIFKLNQVITTSLMRQNEAISLGFINTISVVTSVIILIFALWYIWIQSHAISESGNISLRKSVVILVGVFVLFGIITSVLQFLVGAI